MIRAAVLAGGHASRFGGKPKGLEKIGGERILDRVVRTIRETTGADPLLVANDEAADTWIEGLEVVADTYRDCGSLGGLHAALSHDPSPVLVVAWDMPFVTSELLTQLIQEAEAADVDVSIPESSGPTGVEPMCAVYGPACLEPVTTQLDDEDYRAAGFLEHVRTRIIPLATLEAHGDPAHLFFNVNTPADLAEAEELWRSKHG